MSYSISEIAKLTNVSVRTLHYYDQIGLLSPSMVSQTGYRYYDEDALEKLQQILFYRELDFSLKEIAQIMNASDYRREDALIRQRELLILKKKRISKLIDLLDANLEGEKNMSFQEFDMSEIEAQKEKYAKEVEERWGNTKAYEQSKARTASYQKKDWEEITRKSDEIMREFAQNMHLSPESREASELVKKWQSFIDQTYYDCSDEILEGLGLMYMADARFQHNIDKFGEGTAQFMSDSIKAYCDKSKQK